jgi:hypothetical protein
MNPDTYIHNNLGNIWFDKNVCRGDKITIYEFDDEEQLSMIEFINMISRDYHLNATEVLLRYLPEIESRKKETYTYIRADKSHGDRWAVLMAEDGEERQINLSESYMTFYSINSMELAGATAAATAAASDSSEDDLATWDLKPGMKRCDRLLTWRTDAPCGSPIKETKEACRRCASLKRTHEQSKCSFCLSRDVPAGSKLGACCSSCNEIHRGL